jgi:ABC-type antimicrobial peptide transport system permease subunit
MDGGLILGVGLGVLGLFLFIFSEMEYREKKKAQSSKDDRCEKSTFWPSFIKLMIGAIVGVFVGLMILYGAILMLIQSMLESF